MELAERLRAGDERALARALTVVERRDPRLRDLLAAARRAPGHAHVVGVTGPPGGGKSTLTDGLIERWRADGRTVAVIAVDPSSPYTGGAILGDRVRMQRHTLDRGVFIRSMAARGHLGGLSAATRDAVRVVAAAGRDLCVIETVGVGQSELEVMSAADTVVVVTTPLTGDGIQMIKAGIMEIPDVIAVNKADLPGAERLVRDLRALVHEAVHARARPGRGGNGSAPAPPWEPPVVRCVATEGEGITDLAAAVDRHRRHLESSGEIDARRAGRRIAEVEAIVAELAVQRARRALRRDGAASMDAGSLADDDPWVVAARILDGTGAPPAARGRP